MILLPTCNNVDTFIIVDCKKPYTLEKGCVIKRSFISPVVFFCFQYILSVCTSIAYLVN